MKFKLIFFAILILVLGTNFYFLNSHPDIFTQAKISLSKINSSTSYLGRLKLWQLLVQDNDWVSAATLESDINPTQVASYKSDHQPSELKKKLADLQQKSDKNTDDYLKLAQIQSVLGYSSQAVDSIKKAHQLDPIRSDVDKLFYSIAQ
jgi:hypothetical protein